MTQKRIVFYLGDGDEKLVEWYESIPPRFRSLMVRMAVLNAVNNGLADVERLFPNGSRQPAPPREPENGAHPQLNIVQASGGASAKPTGDSEDELIAFTMANLPQEATPEMRELARKFYKATPYSMEELSKLVGMAGMMSDQEG
jgi:hypothetical protein